MDMSRFLSRIAPIKLDKARGKYRHEPSTKEELRLSGSIAGALVWIGPAESAYPLCIALFMQQRIPRLRFGDIVDINKKFKELRDSTSQLTFLASRAYSIQTVSLFSNVVFKFFTLQSIGQSGSLIGIRFDAPGEKKSLSPHGLV